MTRFERSSEFLGTTQLALPALWKCADKGGSSFSETVRAVISRQKSVVCPAKTDWEWKGMSVGMRRIAPRLDGCGGFWVMLELMPIHFNNLGQENYQQNTARKTVDKFRSCDEATKALRHLVARESLVLGENALQSGRIGGGGRLE